MRVADVGTHIHCSLPGGRSRVRPWRFITKTSHFSGVARCATSLIQLAGGSRFRREQDFATALRRYRDRFPDLVETVGGGDWGRSCRRRSAAAAPTAPACPRARPPDASWPLIVSSIVASLAVPFRS